MPPSQTVAAFLCACVLALVHLVVGRLAPQHDRAQSDAPRSLWLSAAGGVAVAYVFLHVIPELAIHQQRLSDRLDATPTAGESVVYAVALAGLVAFFVLERLMLRARDRGRDDLPRPGAFWLHIASFAAYNLIIGYLLLRRDEEGLAALLVYAFAMGLHLLTTDASLRRHHRHRYDHGARWVLAAALMAGFGLALVTQLPHMMIAMLFAFVAGGIVLNVLKEELPEQNRGRLWPFCAAAAGYAVLLLAA